MKGNIFRTKSFWVSIAICVIPLILSAVYYNEMPDRVATHFNFNNEPNGYSPKWIAAFVIPSFMILLNVLVWVKLENSPQHSEMGRVVKGTLKWIVSVLTLVVECVILMYAVSEINFVRFIPLLIGVLLILIGNYMPKCKRNYFVGIRVPWTLANEDNWNKTHRFAGKVWMICGFVVAMYSLFDLHVAAFIVTVAVISIVPAIYSYCIYRKEK